MSWGVAFYDHFERHFAKPVASEAFRSPSFDRTLQILTYDGVFQDCLLFASLGLTHFHHELGWIGEVVLAVDGGWSDIACVLANACFHLTERRIPMGWGVVVGGIDAVAPEFARRSGKEALYFTHPGFALPRHVQEVQYGSERGSVLMGLFISGAEYSFFRARGAAAFESLLEGRGVDPFHLARRSAL